MRLAQIISIGDKFGRLTVTSIELGPRGGQTCGCLCVCGKEKSITGYQLTKGKHLSCSCFKSELVRGFKLSHGMRYSPEYRSWCHAKERCFTPTNKDFWCYGGRGITMCPRWANSFADFFADMGERPSAGMTLERNDSDGNYEPGNCRWATRKEQGRNTSRNRTFLWRGVQRCIGEIAEMEGVRPGRIGRGLSRYGASIEGAVEYAAYRATYKEIIK